MQEYLDFGNGPVSVRTEYLNQDPDLERLRQIPFNIEKFQRLEQAVHSSKIPSTIFLVMNNFKC